MARVFVGVGSNINPEENIRGGLVAMRRLFGDLIVSSVYQSTAFGFDGADFLNLVVAFDSDLEPARVAGSLRELEVRFGRPPKVPKFSSRTLDLDLLLYDDLVGPVAGQSIPRPDIIRFGFVLCPLAEIAGELCHPVTGERFRDMWNAFEGEGHDLRCVEFTVKSDT